MSSFYELMSQNSVAKPFDNTSMTILFVIKIILKLHNLVFYDYNWKTLETEGQIVIIENVTIWCRLIYLCAGLNRSLFSYQLIIK